MIPQPRHTLNHCLRNEKGDCRQESRREDRGGSLRRLGWWSVVGDRLDGCSSSGRRAVAEGDLGGAPEALQWRVRGTGDVGDLVRSHGQRA